MMFLFRPTFIATTLSFVVIVSTLFGTALASPQFGRPFLHALDAASLDVSSYMHRLSTEASSATISLGSSTILAAAAVPTAHVAGDTPDTSRPGCAMHTAAENPAYKPALAAANGASHLLYQGKQGLVLVSSLAAAAILLVF